MLHDTPRILSRRRRFLLVVMTCLALAPLGAQAFNHPGGLHLQADLNRMRDKVATNAEPWKAGYNKLAADTFSSTSYAPKGYFANVDRGTTNANRSAFEQDCNAAYQQAIMWSITGNTTFRNKALAIIKGWTNANTTFTGKDAQLIVGLNGFKLVNAAEIMRYNHGGQWSAADITKTEIWFKNKWWPHLLGSGAPTGVLDGNWGMAALKTQVVIGVFCNDTARYNSGVAGLTSGCASIQDSIKGDATYLGEETETGRDNGHWQLALGNLAEGAQVCRNNGNNLFATGSQRIKAAFEYFSKYQLGHSVNYTPWKTCQTANNYPTISPRSTTFRPIFEMIRAEYGPSAVPYTTTVTNNNRPEGSVGGAQAGDSTGFGTILYYNTNKP